MSLDEDKIEKIDKVSSKAKPKVEITPEPDRVAPNKEHFDSLMTKPEQVEPIDARRVDTAKTSLIDEVRNLEKQVTGVHKASPEALLAQAQEVVAKIDELKDKLNTPNLEIKSSVQNLLRNKLSHIDENLKVALSKAGVEYKAPETAPVSGNPVERFLGMLTDGQSRLQKLSSEVEAMHINRTELAPAAMLAIQIKVGFIQQELELFTSLLNKALESTKTIMNVQV